MGSSKVLVREVWASNLAYEFSLIRSILPNYSFASMDTEFPGTIHQDPVDKHFYLSPEEAKYQLMRKNVEALKIIQFGLTLADADGKLPNFGTDACYVWEFNFSDFDIYRDACNPASIELLKRQGINFKKNKKEGIDSREFALLAWESGLIKRGSTLNWVTFHSVYDFGFLVKIMRGRYLPTTLDKFMDAVAFYFGQNVYDMKHIMKSCDGLYGGLARVAKSLGVDRVAGKSHQAGSDSLLTLQTYMKLKHTYFDNDEEDLEQLKNVIFGLEPEQEEEEQELELAPVPYVIALNNISFGFEAQQPYASNFCQNPQFLPWQQWAYPPATPITISAFM